MNLPSVARYCPSDTSGFAGPNCASICSCFWSTIPSIAICSCLVPVPRPTLMVTSYSVSHSRGSIGTNLPCKRMTRGLSWYLQSRCRMLRKMSLMPVSAKIRAISSSLPAEAFCMAAIAVAVVFCRMLGSSPCEASVTPVRLAWMLSMYSSIGKDCPATA